MYLFPGTRTFDLSHPFGFPKVGLTTPPTELLKLPLGVFGALITRSSSREVRIRVPLFSVV